jgi:hypothetical protein
MAKLMIYVDLDGAAFDDPYEKRNVLNTVCRRVDEGQEEGTVLDANGNTCCRFVIFDD